MSLITPFIFLFCICTAFAQQDFAARNLATVQKIYNLTVYPNNIPIVKKGASAVPPGLFANNTVGRVTPVGNFSGFEDSIEYFFGLAPVPQSTPSGTAFYGADVVEFSSQCPEVAASVVYLRTGKVDLDTGALIPSAYTTTLKQIAFWRFDADGLVIYYDAWVPNLQRWSQASTGIDYNNVSVQTAAAASLCPTIQERCTGANEQFQSVVECGAVLESKPFGNFDEAWGDNIACRTIHLLLTMVRPEVHCPHVGPKGGSGPNNYKCVDIDYSNFYFNDEQLFGQAQPFMCPQTSYSTY